MTPVTPGITEGGQIIIAMISVLGVLLTTGSAVMIALLNRTRLHSKRTREQVENGHTTNLREEADVRHDENVETLAKVLENQAKVLEEIGSLRRGVRRLFERTDSHADQLHELELTHPRTFQPPSGRHRGEPA